MCRPTYFEVSYAINPWMDPAVPVDTGLALRQWSALADTYHSLGHTVERIEPLPGLPDMVFAANGGVVLDGRVYGSQFRAPQRADEATAYRAWFESRGYPVRIPKYVNEGEGDLVLTDSPIGEIVLAGTGFRTELAAHHELQEYLGRPVVTLQLVDPRFYHLDTALFPLGPATPGTGPGTDPETAPSSGPGDDPGAVTGNVAYYPGAFSEGSLRVLERMFPDAVIASEADAAVLGLNAVSDGRHVVLNEEATGLARQLAARGYVPVPVNLSELRKAGGGPKCCTLEIR